MLRPVHQPYLTTKPFAIGLKPVSPDAIIEVDAHLADDLALKKELFAGDEAAVFRAESGTEAAQEEVLRLVLDCVATRYPGAYSVDKDGVTVLASGDRYTFADFSDELLKLASLVVQEDLCLMRKGDDGWRLAAASVCFPSSWDLADKFSKPMGTIHDPVPGFAGRMLTVVERIFDNLKVDQPVERYNWSLYSDMNLRHSEHHSEGLEDLTDAELSERLALRVERQTLTRLTESRDILFTIRIHVDSIDVLRNHPERSALICGLKKQLTELTPEQSRYKGLDRAMATISAILNRQESID